MKEKEPPERLVLIHKMEITKEQFNQLEPLDRIEYRQKYNSLHKQNEILFLVTLIFILAGKLIGAMIFMIWAFVSLIKAKKNIRLLEKEYFNLQVKRTERRTK